MFKFIGIFPLQAMLTHFTLSATTSFYPRFTWTEKCELLAWTNTVIFQTSFTIANFCSVDPYTLARYFVIYVINDSFHLLLYNRDPLMYFHHVVSFILAFSQRWLSYDNAYAMTQSGAFLEASNILLGTTWLLNKAGYGKTLAVKILGAMSFLAYATLRNVLFPRYIVYYAPKEIGIVMFMLFMPLNLFWTWKIAKMYTRILRKVEGPVLCTSEDAPCVPDSTCDRPQLDLEPYSHLASPAESQLRQRRRSLDDSQTASADDR